MPFDFETQVLPEFIGGLMTAGVVGLALFGYDHLRNVHLEARIRAALGHHSVFESIAPEPVFGITIENVTNTAFLVRHVRLTMEGGTTLLTRYGGAQEVKITESETEDPLTLFGGGADSLEGDDERKFVKLSPYCAARWETKLARFRTCPKFTACAVQIEYRTVFGAHRVVSIMADQSTVEVLNLMAASHFERVHPELFSPID